MIYSKVFKASLLMGSLFLISGCAVRVPTYNSTADTVVALRQMDTKFKVAKVISEDQEDSIACRLGRRVKVPQNLTFDQYIENAFKEEVKMAGVYSDNSNNAISIYMNDLDANSGVSDKGEWEFDANVSSSNGKSFNLISIYQYETSFSGGVTCNELMPDAFLPAVKKFISDIINHPDFKGLIKN